MLKNIFFVCACVYMHVYALLQQRKIIFLKHFAQISGDPYSKIFILTTYALKFEICLIKVLNKKNCNGKCKYLYSENFIEFIETIPVCVVWSNIVAKVYRCYGKWKRFITAFTALSTFTRNYTIFCTSGLQKISCSYKLLDFSNFAILCFWRNFRTEHLLLNTREFSLANSYRKSTSTHLL